MSEAKSMTNRAETTRADAVLRPAVDVIEDASGITLRADMPGVPKERLQVHVEGDTLTIEGEVVLQVAEDMEPTHVELAVPRFRRAFTLSKELDADRVSAEVEHGVLKLRIPKKEHAQPRRIEVKVA